MMSRRTLEGITLGGLISLSAGCASHLTRQEYEDKSYERILEDQKVIMLSAEIAGQEILTLPTLVKAKTKTRKENLAALESAKKILGTALSNDDYATMTLAVQAGTYMQNVTEGNLTHHAHAQMLEELTTESFAQVVGSPHKRALPDFMRIIRGLNTTFDRTVQIEVALARYEQAARRLANPQDREVANSVQKQILKSTQQMKQAVHYAIMLNRSLGNVTNGNHFAELYRKLDRITTGNDPQVYGQGVLNGFSKRIDGKSKSLFLTVREALKDGVSTHFEARQQTLPTRITVLGLYQHGKIDAQRLWSALHIIDREERTATKDLPRDSEQLKLYDFSPVGILTGNYSLLSGRKGYAVKTQKDRKDLTLLVALNYVIGPGINMQVEDNRFAIGCAYLSTFGIMGGVSVPFLKGGSSSGPTGGRGPETGGNDVNGRRGRVSGGNDVSYKFNKHNQLHEQFAVQRTRGIDIHLHNHARNYRVRRENAKYA
jgi:hypothetical protein